MKTTPRSTFGWIACLMLAGCGDSTSSPASKDASAQDGGSCGTLENPGILQVTNLVPALGTSVENRAIVHSFTVVKPPARFANFSLAYGTSHDAYLPRPTYPVFEITESGADLLYQFSVDSWSYAPAHVDMSAGSAFKTLQGCWWQLPSPLFSYNITPGDGGLLSIFMDGAVPAVDAPASEGGSRLFDSSLAEATAEAAAEVNPSLDGGVDAPLGVGQDAAMSDSGAEP